MDFGLSGLALEPGGVRDFAGTPMYMAPEQLDGSGPSVRTDLFSLGVVLYEVLTGRHLFSGRTLTELREEYRKAKSPPPPSEFSGELDPNVDAVILRCLDTDPRRAPHPPWKWPPHSVAPTLCKPFLRRGKRPLPNSSPLPVEQEPCRCAPRGFCCSVSPWFYPDVLHLPGTPPWWACVDGRRVPNCSSTARETSFGKPRLP